MGVAFGICRRHNFVDCFFYNILSKEEAWKQCQEDWTLDKQFCILFCAWVFSDPGEQLIYTEKPIPISQYQLTK